jgi:hypothetical protein
VEFYPMKRRENRKNIPKKMKNNNCKGEENTMGLPINFLAPQTNIDSKGKGHSFRCLYLYFLLLFIWANIVVTIDFGKSFDLTI